MQQFWLRGFEASSLADLMDTMGIQKGSLYKAFGDKRSLFIAALSRYLSMVREGVAADLDCSRRPSEALGALLHRVIAMSRVGNKGRGCLAVNSLIELAPTDPQVAAILGDHFSQLRAEFEATIERGQRTGEFRNDQTPQELARMLGVFVAGLTASVKGGMKPAEAKQAAAAALRVISA